MEEYNELSFVKEQAVRAGQALAGAALGAGGGAGAGVAAAHAAGVPELAAPAAAVGATGSAVLGAIAGYGDSKITNFINGGEKPEIHVREYGAYGVGALAAAAAATKVANDYGLTQVTPAKAVGILAAASGGGAAGTLGVFAGVGVVGVSCAVGGYAGYKAASSYFNRSSAPNSSAPAPPPTQPDVELGGGLRPSARVQAQQRPPAAQLTRGSDSGRAGPSNQAHPQASHTRR